MQRLRLAEALMAAGCDEVGIADTTGYANPASVKHLIRILRAAVGDEAVQGIHLHNTRGLGLANVLAALDAGLTTVDSSLGGLGGCPFRSEEHTSELQSLMRISYAVFCLKKKTQKSKIEYCVNIKQNLRIHKHTH